MRLHLLSRTLFSKTSAFFLQFGNTLDSSDEREACCAAKTFIKIIIETICFKTGSRLDWALMDTRKMGCCGRCCPINADTNFDANYRTLNNAYCCTRVQSVRIEKSFELTADNGCELVVLNECNGPSTERRPRYAVGDSVRVQGV